MTAVSSGNGARFAQQPLAGGGTPTRCWIGWDRGIPELDIGDCPGLVLVAPHPDDETLGLGATVSALGTRGVTVQVVTVTDGGAARPGLPAPEHSRLETARRAEARTAANILGAMPPIFLGLPDGHVERHVTRLADVLGELLGAYPPGVWCAATWRGDGHPDHEATGRAAAIAAGRSGAVLLEYPVWMWHWARPGDDAVPWERAARIKADPAALRRKARAIRVFATQLQPPEPGGAPVLPPFVLQRLMAVGEVVFR